VLDILASALSADGSRPVLRSDDGVACVWLRTAMPAAGELRTAAAVHAALGRGVLVLA
jgi:hypothetical protein